MSYVVGQKVYGACLWMGEPTVDEATVVRTGKVLAWLSPPGASWGFRSREPHDSPLIHATKLAALESAADRQKAKCEALEEQLREAQRGWDALMRAAAEERREAGA